MNQLIELASRSEGLECFLALNFGVKSSKIIHYFKGKKKPFQIHNLIDDTTIHLDKRQLMNNKLTMVGEALVKGALIAEN